MKEKVYEKMLLFCAMASTLVVVLVGLFVFLQGYPLIAKTGFISFVFGKEWLPGGGVFGIFPMVIGTLAVTLGALVIGVPLGVTTAVFLAEYAPGIVTPWIRRAVELLAGIPSVVYGLFGMTVIVPLVRYTAVHWFGGVLSPEMKTGFGIIAASIVLGIMILPTIVSISEDALRAVPQEYKKGSYALGVPRWQTIIHNTIPAASSGIMAGVVLGMGRAVGETMAILMVAGNAPALPRSIFSPTRTLSGNIGLEMSYASGEHAQALFATGIVLFIVIMLLNSFALFIAGKGVKVR
ncbi:MAG: phosphate ABC transporter permease subunit PstC [Thermoanaerobacterales bacterium]|nr:phosphate ABC transporter permease subunit PstC [Thermoanaerobacterales bacterium]